MLALLFDEVEDVFPPISGDAAQIIARLEFTDAVPSGSVSGSGSVSVSVSGSGMGPLRVASR